MKTKFARPSRKPMPIQGNKHAGIYGAKKDICPTPKGTVYFHMGLPQLLVSRLLEMYPNMSAYKAVKQFLLDNIPPA